jgi:hypothetical protein
MGLYLDLVNLIGSVLYPTSLTQPHTGHTKMKKNARLQTASYPTSAHQHTPHTPHTPHNCPPPHLEHAVPLHQPDTTHHHHPDLTRKAWASADVHALRQCTNRGLERCRTATNGETPPLLSSLSLGSTSQPVTPPLALAVRQVVCLGLIHWHSLVLPHRSIPRHPLLSLRTSATPPPLSLSL